MTQPAPAIPVQDRVLILDFGSQFTQLIARRVRESGVYCEILPASADPARIEAASGAPLTDEIRAIIAELQPGGWGGDAPPPAYEPEPPRTPGGRLTTDGYRGGSGRTTH